MELHSRVRCSAGVALTAILVTVGPAAAQDQPLTATMAPSELAGRIDDGSAPYVLDVRTAEEYADGHIAGAVNISHTELADRLGELDFAASEEIVVYCRSGRRAANAAATLVNAGFTGVRDLEGHMQGWEAAELPIMKPGAQSIDPEDADPSDSNGDDR